MADKPGAGARTGGLSRGHAADDRSEEADAGLEVHRAAVGFADAAGPGDHGRALDVQLYDQNGQPIYNEPVGGKNSKAKQTAKDLQKSRWDKS